MPKMNQLYLPLSLMDTRDCFVFDPIVNEEKLNLGPGRENVVKKVFYFDPEALPDNYDKYIDQEKKDPEIVSRYESYPVGCTAYENFFTHEEMTKMELQIEDTEQLCSKSKFLMWLKYNRRLSPGDCTVDIQKAQADSDQVLLWLQIYVDEGTTQ